MERQGRPPKKLGTTAYAVLGLLALRDWTTYDLARQMERGVGRMWSASPAMVYQEPKNLVAHGLATVRDDPVGRRPRAVYSITAAGREVLAAWLTAAPAPPDLQFEGLLKVLFADQGPPSSNQATLHAIRAWAQEARVAAAHRAEQYLEGDYIEGLDLDQRAPIVIQTLTFLAEFYDLLDRWTQWAEQFAPPGAVPGTHRREAINAALETIAAGGRVVPEGHPPNQVS